MGIGAIMFGMTGMTDMIVIIAGIAIKRVIV